ncbi:hypothetical protein A2239_02400 [Candidatus Uhrbacteria bacterium RIFOXYA2_FULL_40_9]|nr:MAG: hypothetical protein UT94_C0031G0026 [Candidatus Uhrbacteria bacterium GW2011_GWF2_40_263]OGL93916.1 MAG: hypothetical protein A2239_02400 [Candidatus Uhrbacteria bacterium RIFOXYA2_FULL_40_9]OGL97587.1 MAG: hypothetical protein A2332_01070 [Candidatus Uhrbacteria bacterium RIFOXYB2_FULL_41_18]HBK35261.1 hypothetical protein [Candidatus Uhrbacteria bacterium]HCB56106.1 hypothetical protein [Candidatus Uhrbacteria bacterium]
MSELTQKSIESFFEEYGVTDPDIKAHLLFQVTDIIYNYNQNVIKWEKEPDEYKKKQLLTSLEEISKKIKQIFEKELNT